MNVTSKINDILKDWNPIGVSGKDLENEYTRYIEEIILCVKNNGDLLSLINDIEGNRIGFFYTKEEERKSVVARILELFQQNKS
ncbi:hypothetical protein ACFPIK_08670 [Algoriphagus aquatilis]|jgi:hypothetical protein|uniref:DUF1871 family protein n=1 Tax=Algoriphagus aquatilis TaxID=490186 RepID=A0ABW0BY00_9BACT